MTDFALSAEDEYLESLEPQEDEDSAALVTALHDALKHLTARQRFVVEMRYGMRDGEPYTLEDIAEVMGLDHKTVVEHEQAAIRRLGTRLDPQNYPPKHK